MNECVPDWNVVRLMLYLVVEWWLAVAYDSRQIEWGSVLCDCGPECMIQIPEHPPEELEDSQSKTIFYPSASQMKPPCPAL